jgi:hypothetical protein
VTLCSAIFVLAILTTRRQSVGEAISTWPADHAEEVGHNLDNLIPPPAFPYLAGFDEIIANVTKL